MRFRLVLSLMGISYADHSKACKGLIKNAVDIYCSEYTAGALELSGHRLHIIEPLKQFTVGGWKIKPFLLVHDVPNLGFLLVRGAVKVLFACDTNYIPYRFTGLTHIILGVNYDLEILKDNVMAGRLDSDLAARIIKNHMSLQTAIGFFQANDMAAVEEIHLIHLSAGNSDAAMFKSEIERVTARPVYAGGKERNRNNG